MTILFNGKDCSISELSKLPGCVRSVQNLRACIKAGRKSLDQCIYEEPHVSKANSAKHSKDDASYRRKVSQTYDEEGRLFTSFMKLFTTTSVSYETELHK